MRKNLIKKNKKRLSVGLPKRLTEGQKYFFMILKYSFSLATTLFTYKTIENPLYVFAGVIELFLIIVLSNCIMNKSPIIGYGVNSILILLFNIQMLVLYFGNTFVTLVMITNLSSAEALSGKGFEYGMGIVAVILFSLLPVAHIKAKNPRNYYLCLSVGLAMELCFGLTVGSTFFPLYDYYTLGEESRAQLKQYKLIASADDSSKEFYKETVQDYRQKDEQLGENPNVILVFAEGFSQDIVDDEREIMPNIAQFETECLNFTGYYNHTFATYRGIIGQLYSGYQLENLDRSYLPSMQSVLLDEGYKTTFINTEPYNEDYTAYVESFKFNEVLGDTSDPKGGAHSISDRDVYKMLKKAALQKGKEEDPYFIAMYTFGTHVSLQSPDKKFGDGTCDLLNRFYNMDYQFGEFLEEFKNNEAFDNTILVLTTDHATYMDSEFSVTFPDSERENIEVDEIPLCIYYNGIEPETIDVSGKNTLDLTPTILDYMDVSAPNYFLGESLFNVGKDGGEFDTIFNEGESYYSTAQGVISDVEEKEKREIKEKLVKYFAVKSKRTDDSLDETSWVHRDLNGVTLLDLKIRIDNMRKEKKQMIMPEVRYPEESVRE